MNSLALLLLVAAAAFYSVEAQQSQHDGCRMCEIVLNFAEHHLRRNPGFTQAQLSTELHRDCQRVGQHFHSPNATAHCDQFADQNIATIFRDIKAHKRPRTVCRDIGLCMQADQPEVRRVKRQSTGQKACHMCEVVLNWARHHLRNNPNFNQAQLATELHRDCTRLGHHFHSANGTAMCMNLVNSNMATIFSDMKAGKRPRMVCQDIGLCQHVEEKAQVEPVQLGRECLGCEFLLNKAIMHMGTGNYNEASLHRQLTAECNAAPAFLRGSCNRLVNSHIDQIYRDLATRHETGHAACVDLGYCSA